MRRRISSEAFAEMQALVAPKEKTEGDRRRDEKKQLSEARMKRWPDTLEAQRKRKEEAYWRRLEAQEERRKKLDAEEDERKARERKEKIEYASQTIYRNTDKIKRLGFAEHLSDCLHIRDQQLELKSRIAQAEKEWEAQFVVEERKKLQEMEAREIAEQEARKQKAKEIAKTQQEQLEEVRERYIESLREQEEVGKQIVEEAKRAAEEERERIRRKQEEARENQIAVLKANEDLKKIKAEHARLEAEEDAKIAQYAKQKAELKERQARQFAKIEGAKQRRRDEMIEQGIRRLQDMTQQNNQRLENEIAEARRVEDERYRKLAEKRAAFEKTIDDSRRNQMEQRRREKEVQEQKEREYATRWREYNKGAEELERLEREAELRAARQHSQILLNQAQEKHERLLDERREEIYQARTLANQEQVTIDDFKQVALERIAAVEGAGKNSYPLRKCLNDVLAGR